MILVGVAHSVESLMEIVPLLEWAHSPRVTPDNNATNACDIKNICMLQKNLWVYVFILSCTYL